MLKQSQILVPLKLAVLNSRSGSSYVSDSTFEIIVVVSVLTAAINKYIPLINTCVTTHADYKKKNPTKKQTKKPRKKKNKQVSKQTSNHVTDEPIKLIVHK